MEESKLIKVFKRLSQGSKQSVQNGQDLDDFDKYLHVERPIEKAVRKEMDEIRAQNGGLLLLVGSAGDGKSHMIASLKKTILTLSIAMMLRKVQTPKLKLVSTSSNVWRILTVNLLLPPTPNLW